MSTIVGRQQQITLNTGGNPATSQALLWLPDNYSTSDKTYPLIISLPGTGEQGSNINLLLHDGQMAKRIADGFSPDIIVCTPQGPASSWGWNIPHISNFIDQLIKNYRIDASKVFLTGLSAGAWGIQQQFTDVNFYKKVAAIALVSSGSTVDAGCKNIAAANIPTWIICGDADAHIVDANNEKTIIKNALFTSLPGVGHSAWYQAYNPVSKFTELGNRSIYDWFLSVTSSQPVDPAPEPKPEPAPPVETKPEPPVEAPAEDTTIIDWLLLKDGSVLFYRANGETFTLTNIDRVDYFIDLKQWQVRYRGKSANTVIK